MFGLRKAYDLPLNDTNMQNMSHKDWRHLVKSTLIRHAFLELKKESAINKKQIILNLCCLNLQHTILTLILSMILCDIQGAYQDV